MANLFQSRKRRFTDSILMHTEFDRSYAGVIRIYPFKRLKVTMDHKPREGTRAYLDIQGKWWSGGYEPPNYAFKDKEPYDRGGQATYIPLGFSSLDIIPLNNGGRFFSQKHASPTNLFTSVDYYPDRELTVIHSQEQLEEFSEDLGYFLELMGVPQDETSKLRFEIFGKLNYDPSRIAKDYPHVSLVDQAEDFATKGSKRMSSITELIVHLHDQGLSDEEIDKRLFG